MQSHFYSGHIKNSSASVCWMLPSPTCEFCCKLTVVIVMKKGPTQFCQHKGQTQKNDKFAATYGFTERLWWATYTKQTTMPYKDDSKYQVWSVNLNACFKEKHFSALLAQFCKREGGGGGWGEVLYTRSPMRLVRNLGKKSEISHIFPVSIQWSSCWAATFHIHRKAVKVNLIHCEILHI